MKTTNFCTVCPRKCKTNRTFEKGFCNESDTISIAKVIKNFQWEEPCITGKKGTLAIFFSGCNLRCDYCQNYEISRGESGQIFSIEMFRRLIEENQENHSSIDLITPTHFSEQINKAFQKITKKIPIIWNTNSYETEENIKLVSTFVDIFLADLKYADDKLGQQFSNCKDYYSKSIIAIKKMDESKIDKFENEQMLEGLIVRHLVLPNHIDNSFKVLDIIKKNFSTRKISIMSQFTPNGKSCLNRKLKPIEYKAVLSHLNKLGLVNGYIQDFESADASFVPDFK